MSELSCDSIISVYLQMVSKTQADLQVPEYSEIYLRSALKEMNGKNCAISADTLKLYRKLLVIYYCEKYPSLMPVITIMERCFTKEEIYNVINEKKDLLCKWLEFKNNIPKRSETDISNMCSSEKRILTKKLKLESLK